MPEGGTELCEDGSRGLPTTGDGAERRAMARPAVTVEGDAIGHYDGPDWIQREIGGTPPPSSWNPRHCVRFYGQRAEVIGTE